MSLCLYVIVLMWLCIMSRPYLGGNEDAVEVDISVCDGIHGQRRDAFGVKFFHDVFPMGDDGGQCNVELLGYLFVDIALHNQCKHLNFAVGEHGRLLRHGLLILMMAVGMAFPLQGHQCAYNLAFGLVDAKGVEPWELIVGRRSSGKHNGLTAVLLKIITILEEYVKRDEEVGNGLGLIGLELGKRAEGLDFGHGYDVVQQLFHANSSRRV